MAEVKRDWRARRKGPVYCSPACGGGCTHSAYLLALKHGKALAKKAGKGWTYRVWENLGWHYAAKRGIMDLHEWRHHGKVTGYWLAIQTNPQLSIDGTSPRDCFKRALKKVQELEDLMTLIRGNL